MTRTWAAVLSARPMYSSSLTSPNHPTFSRQGGYIPSLGSGPSRHLPLSKSAPYSSGSEPTGSAALLERPHGTGTAHKAALMGGSRWGRTWGRQAGQPGLAASAQGSWDWSPEPAACSKSPPSSARSAAQEGSGEVLVRLRSSGGRRRGQDAAQRGPSKPSQGVHPRSWREDWTNGLPGGPAGCTSSPEGGGRDRVIGFPKGGRGPVDRVLVQVLPPHGTATHRRLKMDPRKEGLTDWATGHSVRRLRRTSFPVLPCTGPSSQEAVSATGRPQSAGTPGFGGESQRSSSPPRWGLPTDPCSPTSCGQ